MRRSLTKTAGRRGLSKRRRSPLAPLPGNPRSRAFLHRAGGRDRPEGGAAAAGDLGTSRVGLIETQPFEVMAYWEAAVQALAAASRRVGDPDAKLVLRFRDASGGGKEAMAAFDIALDRPWGTRFLKLGASFRALRCDLGVLSAEGRFAPLVRSNVAQTPRHEESERYEEHFRTLPAAGARVPSPGSPPVPPVRKPEAAPAPMPSPMPVSPAEAAIDLSIFNGEVRKIQERIRQIQEEAAVAGPVIPHGEKPFYAGGMAHLWKDAPPSRIAPEAMAQSGRIPGGPQDAFGPLGAGFAGAVGFAPAQGDPGAAPAEPVLFGDAASGASVFTGASSPAPRIPEDSVDLELHADLIIYGRTRPGTKVFISGARIPVRGDGTFEARFSLPPSAAREPRSVRFDEVR